MSTRWDNCVQRVQYNTDGIDPDSCTNVLIEDYHYCAVPYAGHL